MSLFLRISPVLSRYLSLACHLVLGTRYTAYIYAYCSAKYLLPMQFYKVTQMQHLVVVGYCSNQFAATFLPMVSYFISMLIICCMSSVAYLLLI